MLVALNFFVFMHQVMLPDAELHMFVVTYGLIPARLTSELGGGGIITGFLPILTYQFLHGGWLHLFGNMLYLWVFGDNIEDRVGHFRYLLFFLLAGALSGLVQVFFQAYSGIPIIGASGAVAGVLGAYLVSCPRARVLALVPIFFWVPVELPASIFLGFWFIFQVFSGVASIGAVVAVAWWAHIGGFIAGMLLISTFSNQVRCD